ncbi:methionyl-tRNA formyltransferase [Ezakiella coagulans]|uniref:methionyl-tRNA formyltransferase n=1 Tax=Ezakiella coagulans TaxID=46507 RepID=UPI002014846A|nr:methionyl-tRNA formyltransferase [Ezakiella coagulans]UQK60629.1 methionyl-tRNA formyltransferase [Ezakiella coagulans]
MNSSIVFFSSTDFGASILEKLIEENENVVAVVTRTDKVRKRGNKVDMTPVKKVALEHNIEVLEYDRIDEEGKAKLKEISPDFFVVVAYGAILSEEVLNIPKISPINIHASLLPNLRGASPIESAILLGEKKTGISYMRMNKGLDTGDVYGKIEVEISETETFDTLNEKLLNVTNKSINTILKDVSEGLEPFPQEGESSYAKKILKDDTIIDFSKNAVDVKNMINSLSTHIGAVAFIESNRYKFFNARTANVKLTPREIKCDGGRIFIGAGDAAVEILNIQAPGKKRMDAKSFLLGNNLEGFVDGKDN